MEQELWKDIKGYKGRYQVSNLGRIKSFLSSEPRILKPQPNVVTAYFYIGLMSADGTYKRPRLHRLVAKAFISQPTKQHRHVNHLNCDKTDNRACNLEWTTPRQNLEHYANHIGLTYSERMKRLSAMASAKKYGKPASHYYQWDTKPPSTTLRPL